MRRPQTLSEWVKLGVAVGTVYQMAEHYRGKYLTWKRDRHNATLYAVSFDADDVSWLYRQLSMWGLEQSSTQNKRSLLVTHKDSRLAEIPSEHDTSIRLNFQGEPIEFWWHEVGGKEVESANGMSFYVKKPTQLLTVICPNLECRDRFMRFVEKNWLSSSEKINWVYRSGKMGGWRSVRQLTPRPVDSLVLPEGMFDDMVSDIERFMDSEDRYIEMGIPYHRGLLMYGPPGTGKSSTICTLASHFDKHVYFLSVSELEGNSALIDCVSGMGSGQFLVLEDVDIVKPSHEREGSSDGVTLDGLLNVLDGVLTPDGLITFMTTNDIPDENGVFSKLDSALVRPGRADRLFELGCLDQEQLNRMVVRFLGPEFDGQIEMMRQNVTPAQITECLKSSFDRDPTHIASCIREVVSEGYVPPTRPKKITFDTGYDVAETDDESVPDRG